MNVSERIIMSKKTFCVSRGRGSASYQKRNLLRDMRMERKREDLPYLIRVNGITLMGAYTLAEARTTAYRELQTWGKGSYAEVLDNVTWVTLWEKELN